MNHVKEWQAALARKTALNLCSTKPVAARITGWKPPQIGWFKLNVDASLFTGEPFFSVGMLMRNNSGVFMRGKTLKSLVSVMEAEMRGVQAALDWIDEVGFQNVIIECDSEMVVKALQSTCSYYLEIGHVIESCRSRLDHRVDITLCHVKKQANKGAHLMARVPVSLNCYKEFLSSPSLLLETLASDFRS